MFMQPSDQPLTEAELDELQDLLLGPEEEDDKDSDCILGVDELHGFLTAILCTPSMLMPSEYMPRVFGDREWRSMEEAQRAMDLLMQFQNEINTDLRAGDFQPLLTQRELPEGRTAIITGDWCYGFVRGMRLRPEEWVIEDERFRTFITPIMAMAETDPESETARWADENHDILVEQLPGIAMAVYDYMVKRRKPPQSQTIKSPPKIGRNDPCPCGSGRKYKKCCGSGDKTRLLH